tara:strand:- start:290 stop:514 length:225 start_codon:yes stop_codon:yes gene_type:complete
MSKPKNDPDKTPPPPPIWPLNKKQQSEGIGDTVSKLIKTLSGGKIKECNKCKERKAKLNRVFPYKKDNDEVQDN